MNEYFATSNSTHEMKHVVELEKDHNITTRREAKANTNYRLSSIGNPQLSKA